jgi:hypothetical protein
MLFYLGDQPLTEYCFQGSEKLSVLDVSNVEDKYEILLGMKELASKGMAAEAVEEVNIIDPNFFGQNSVLLFQLKQVSGFYLLSIAFSLLILYQTARGCH